MAGVKLVTYHQGVHGRVGGPWKRYELGASNDYTIYVE